MTCVYLISQGNSEWGPVKVGVANQPHRRVSELQIGNPVKLYVRRLWDLGDRSRAFHIEGMVLDEMTPYRMEGEWIDADVFGMCGLVNERIRETYCS
jgi:hypothetical protein